MIRSTVHLGEKLGSLPAGILCLTGGGGKTTLLYALGASLAQSGNTVLCTTTTRMHHPGHASAAPVFPFAAYPDPAGIPTLSSGALLAARPPDCEPGREQDKTKIYGYSPAEIDALHRRSVAARIIVEADGAAGRPVKAPEIHEPVIPSLTVAVIAVIGLGCAGARFSPETVFRTERFAAVTGLASGETITPGSLALLALHPLGLFKNCPPGAARLLFLNQADLPGAAEAGRAVAAAVEFLDRNVMQGIFMGSLHRDGLTCENLLPV